MLLSARTAGSTRETMRAQIKCLAGVMFPIALGSAVFLYVEVPSRLAPSSDPPPDRRRIARMEMEVVESALEMFREDIGRYPTTGEGLEALIKNPGLTGWRGSYLRRTTVPRDLDGRSLNYESSGERFVISSREPPFLAGNAGESGIPEN